jgi:hypothetical protein
LWFGSADDRAPLRAAARRSGVALWPPLTRG